MAAPTKAATEAPDELQDAAAAAAERANEALGAHEDDDDQPEPSPYAQHITRGDDVTTIEFRGVKLTFPTSRAKWRTKAMQALQQGFATGNDLNIFKGVELFLGPQQWDALDAVAPTMGDFWEFWPIFTEATEILKTGGES